MQARPEKFLLCRPEGGLNDMLCQIGNCMEYAEKHARTLVIDTVSTQYKDALSQYLVPRDDGILFINQELNNHLQTLSVFPATLSGRLNSYSHFYSTLRKIYVASDTLVPLSFDFSRDYEEQLLVHHTCGGGADSIKALHRLRLTETIVEKFHARIGIVGRNYAGIHVRHTDYQTAYVQFFNTLAGKIPQDRIVICTDSREVLEYGKRFFRKPIYNFTALPDLGGKPLHSNRLLDKQRVNTDSILDLITLARARSLFVTKVSQGHLSGYSRLAATLNQNQRIVDSLLGVPGRTARPGTV